MIDLISCLYFRNFLREAHFLQKKNMSPIKCKKPCPKNCNAWIVLKSHKLEMITKWIYRTKWLDFLLVGWIEISSLKWLRKEKSRTKKYLKTKWNWSARLLLSRRSKVHLLWKSISFVRVWFWEDFELYMERQTEKLNSIVEPQNMGKFPCAAEIIRKLEMTMEKLTKENQDLHNRRGKSVGLNLRNWDSSFRFCIIRIFTTVQVHGSLEDSIISVRIRVLFYHGSDDFSSRFLKVSRITKWFIRDSPHGSNLLFFRHSWWICDGFLQKNWRFENKQTSIGASRKFKSNCDHKNCNYKQIPKDIYTHDVHF